MSKAKQTLTQAFLERMSRGAVPMGGFYWVDPKELRSRSETVRAAEKAKPAEDRNVPAHGLYAAPAGERS
jgi:hypothetical protein